MPQADDGWETVSDPNEIQKVLGKAGAAKAAESARVASHPEAQETASARDKTRAALAIVERVQPALDRVKDLQRRYMSGTGLAGLGEYNPLDQHNQQYDAAVKILTSIARPATRTPGEGSMSDFETKLATAMLPDRWKMDSYNNEAIRGMQSLIDQARKQYGTMIGGGLPAAPPRPPSADDLRKKYGLK